MRQPSGLPPHADRPAAPPRRTSWRSVERQLPLLMTGVLAITVASGLLVTYATLAQSARERNAARLGGTAQRLATDAETNLRAVGARLRQAARDSATIRVVEGASLPAGVVPARFAEDLDSVRVLLTALLSGGDTTRSVELWTADGRRVAWVGRDHLAATVASAPREGALLPVANRGLDGLDPSDSLIVGRVHLAGDEVHLWTAAPVMAGGERIGYIARQARITGNTSAAQRLRDLTGADINAYFRNVDDSLWVSVAGTPAQPPVARSTSDSHAIVHRSGVGDMLLVEERIGGTPLAFALEVPLASVLAAPRASLARLALLSVVLTILGAVAAWLISRRFTRPLASLTAAAESVATGDYEARVEPGTSEELARLAASFNRMAEQVGAARRALEEQTAAAMAAHAEAEAASRAKSQFLAVMSHELRTPLNAIGGYTELMELGLRGPVTEEQRRDLARIRASQQHLLGLISGVLDLSRIESGRVTYQLSPIALEPFLAGVSALVEPQAAAKSLGLHLEPCDPSLAVTADHEKLRQILLNLLSNAIRFTPRDGRITIRAHADGDALVAIEVEDTGVGISEDAIEQIFEPFVQLDRSLTSQREGIGLGLSISRDLARGMGGDLGVESCVGSGSCFRLTLPRAELPPGAPPTRFSGELPAATEQR